MKLAHHDLLMMIGRLGLVALGGLGLWAILERAGNAPSRSGSPVSAQTGEPSRSAVSAPPAPARPAPSLLSSWLQTPILAADRFVGFGPSSPTVAGEHIPPPVAGLQFQLSPPYEIRDGISFASGDVTVTLAGLATAPREAVCFNDAKLQWACGLRARAALNNLIRGAEVSCFGDRHGAQPVQVRCTLRGADLAAMLVRSGFARPLDGTAYADDMAAARAGRLGLWDGDWTLREPQTSQ